MTEQKPPTDDFSPFEEQAMKDQKQNQEHESNDQSRTRHHEPEQGAAARRTLLNTGAISAAAALLGLVAACSSDDDSGSPATGGGGSGGKAGAGNAGKSGSGGNAGSTSNGGSSAAAGEAGSGGTTSAGAAGEAAGAAGAPETPDADLAPLNALLTAEYNAITAYAAGATLIGAAPTTDPLYSLRQLITNIAVSIQTQHRLHASALADAIEALNGTPVNEADVAAKFTPPAALVANPTITNVLKFAAGAERGATVAYNQVLAALEDAQLRFLASSIEGDESQHFIVLAALVLGLASPGPNLSESTAATVVPKAFVVTVDAKPGLDMGPPDYFA